ncbi:hypothetical protein [Cryptosporangium japonicum]|uniref:hypothetical protein n=1 Tax=Cryptosporangium japonicum TaxID=80872 RepID=UPI0031CE3084
MRSTSIWESSRPQPDPAEAPDEAPASSPEPVDQTPPDEAPEPPRPVAIRWPELWERARRTPLVWIAAFVVGALLGGVAVHGWETQAADAARRDAVQLTARVAEDAASSASWTGARQPWTLRIVLTNTGPNDVRLRDATLPDRRYTSNLREVSRGVRIPAGQETWISMDVTHSCRRGGPASAPHDVALTVAPAGRPERDVRVRLADDNTLFVDTARQKCQTVASDIWVTSELVGEPADLDTVLVTPIRIRQHDRRAVAVRELRTPTPGLSMLASTRPIDFVEDVTPVTALRWSIADCARARAVVYAEVGISGVVQLSNGDPSIRTAIVLDANAVLAIVRFITRSCG